MGRPLRIDDPGIWHHVINRGAARQPIFFSDRDRVEFERLLGLAHDRFDIRIHAYCLMGNHFHMLVECPDGGLSQAMHLVGSVYVRRVNARLERDGPMFRDRFYAKQVRNDAYLMRLVRYIHRNPVAIVGEEALLSYRWSSLRAYLGHRTVPVWLRTGQVLRLFGGADELLLSTACAPPLELPDVDADSVLAAIGVAVDELQADRPARGLERTIATLMLERHGALTEHGRRALVTALGAPTLAAQRAARSRALRRLASDPALDRVVDAVLDLVA